MVYRAPQGPIKFKHSSIKSAFTAVRCSSMVETEKTNNRRNGSMCIESKTVGRVAKRPSIRSDEVIIASKKLKKSPSPKLLRRRPSKLKERRVTSPPFYGFETSVVNNFVTVNMNNNWERDDLKKKKQLQEEADLEFAKKLQAELNGYGRYSTRQGCAKRQVTIDEMIKGQYKVEV